MVWFRVDDILPFHQRVIEAGNAAMGLWVRAGAWSSGQLTDGFVPKTVARQLGSPTEIRRLVQSGLWIEEVDGYRFHAWAEDGTGTKRQPTRAEVEAQRKSERERKAIYRSKRDGSTSVPAGVPAGQTVGHPADVRQASGHPGPARPDPLPSEGGARSAHPPVDNSRPAATCPRHPSGTDRPCRACGDARRAHDDWTPPAIPAPSRPSAWREGLCRDHLQNVDTCEMCAYENRHAANVLHGHFGTGVA